MKWINKITKSCNEATCYGLSEQCVKGNELDRYDRYNRSHKAFKIKITTQFELAAKQTEVSKLFFKQRLRIARAVKGSSRVAFDNFDS